ncbi:dihydrofolate reductase [soil metagenome]
MAENRVIGHQGKLPWHLPEDLKFFKRTTSGHPVLMGRKTFDSIIEAIGKPLPQRRNIVLSRTMAAREDVQVIRALEELWKLPLLNVPVYLIGGAQLYEALLPECDELLLTLIKKTYEGDAFFPHFEDRFELKEILGGEDDFEFRRYVRRSP